LLIITKFLKLKKMNQEGIVRRADLQFRAEYPEIITIIYKISEWSYILYCETVREDFDDIEHQFEGKIKSATTPLKLSLEKPKDFLEIISPISDNQISKDFEGLSFTIPLLFNLLLSKFPHIKFSKIETIKNEKITVYTSRVTEKEPNVTTYRFLNTIDREKIMKFLQGLKIPAVFEIIDEEILIPADDFPQYQQNPIQILHSARLRKNTSFDFSKRDDALWFDNIDKIFDGSFKKKDLDFYHTGHYSCYVDFSAFENIDIRNHLLLFQTIYLTPPFDKNIVHWLAEASISKNEFLDLIAKGRIKLILTQPEFRYDMTFIVEAYSVNPNAVITRRALAVLQQIDLVEMSDNYLLNDPKILKELVPIFMHVAKNLNLDSKFLYETLLWPIKARRKSFEHLFIKGIFGTASFGVNNAIETKYSELAGHDLSFDFTVNSSTIHLASSLDATYFPFKSENGYSDQFYANAMGDLLNFYKNANITNLNSYLENKEQAHKGVIQINPIDVIHINNYISIAELEREIAKNAAPFGGKFLMETLGVLSEEDRIQKIQYYNSEVIKNINRKEKSAFAIDLGTNLALDGAGMLTGFPFIGSALSVIKKSSKVIIDNIGPNDFSNKLENAVKNPDKSNIHYLTKINRVAKLKPQ